MTPEKSLSLLLVLMCFGGMGFSLFGLYILILITGAVENKRRKEVENATRPAQL